MSSRKNTFMAPDSEMRAASASLLSLLGIVYNTCAHASGVSHMPVFGGTSLLVSCIYRQSSPPHPLARSCFQEPSMPAISLWQVSWLPEGFGMP